MVTSAEGWLQRAYPELFGDWWEVYIKTSREEATLPHCRICNLRNHTGLHYGVYTCEADKQFLKRTFHDRIVYSICDLQCPPRTRGWCQYCRVRSSLLTGINLKMIRMGAKVEKQDRPPKSRKSKSNREICVKREIDGSPPGNFLLEYHYPSGNPTYLQASPPPSVKIDPGSPPPGNSVMGYYYPSGHPGAGNHLPPQSPPFSMKGDRHPSGSSTHSTYPPVHNTIEELRSSWIPPSQPQSYERFYSHSQMSLLSRYHTGPERVQSPPHQPPQSPEYILPSEIPGHPRSFQTNQQSNQPFPFHSDHHVAYPTPLYSNTYLMEMWRHQYQWPNSGHAEMPTPSPSPPCSLPSEVQEEPLDLSSPTNLSPASSPPLPYSPSSKGSPSASRPPSSASRHVSPVGLLRSKNLEKSFNKLSVNSAVLQEALSLVSMNSLGLMNLSRVSDILPD